MKRCRRMCSLQRSVSVSRREAKPKAVWGDRLTTVFPRQGHYALDPVNVSRYPAADVTIERIGDLVEVDAATLLAR